MIKYWLVGLILFFSLTISSFGQGTSFHGGFVSSDVTFFVDTATIQTSKRVGAMIGIDHEIRLAENLYQVIGLEYFPRGYRVKSDTVDSFITRIDYLNIPLSLRYKFDLEDIWMTFEAGPYIGFALYGRTKSDQGIVRYEFGNEEGDLKRLDLGLKLGYTVEIEQVRLGISYNTGFLNVSASRSETLKLRAFVFSVGLLL
ncbi:MAG: PorT family protein [Bacteroidales bacterium]|nr:PorT family protein [Bacteroidales bacterium]